MKIKTAELTGRALDWAVMRVKAGKPLHTRSPFLVAAKYSTEWECGGPIMEQEGISVAYIDDNIADGAWFSSTVGGDENAEGPTPLVAAMRCYVGHILGDEVEILPELI